MALRQEIERQGNWLFKRRSEFPILLLVLMLVELWLDPPPVLGGAGEAVWSLVCLGVAALGEGIRAYTVGRVPGGTSARQTREPGGGELNTTGWYSVVRHPLYLGNFLIWAGLALWLRSWEFELIVILVFWVYYERIMLAEEGYLRGVFGAAYEAWADTTPAFIPRLRGWRPAALPFSTRVVIRREHSSCFAIVVTYAAMVYLRDLMHGGGFQLHPPVAAFLVVAFVAFVVAVGLTRYTSLLHVEGR